MRILIATTYRGVSGGTETYLRSLLPALLDRGHDVGLVHLVDVPGDDKRIDDGLDLPRWYARNSVPEEAFHWRPDVCYLQMTDSATVDASLAVRLPTVLYAHNFYGACATGFKYHGGEHPVPCSYQFGVACLARNYTLGCGVRNPVQLWTNYRKQVKRRRLLPKVRTVLTASRYMADEMIAHGADPSRTSVVPLFPSALEPDENPPTYRAPRGKLLFLGRFTSVKGGRLLIEAAGLVAKDVPVELTFAGAGPDDEEWRRAAEKSCVPTTFHSWLEGERLDELRRDSDLLAVPSVWPEPFGLVGIEAATQGLPAVAYDVGGVSDWLTTGITGELAPSPPTASGLAAAIVRALGDPEHHHRLRIGAWEYSHRFSLVRHLELLEPILADAAGGRTTREVDGSQTVRSPGELVRDLPLLKGVS